MPKTQSINTKTRFTSLSCEAPVDAKTIPPTTSSRVTVYTITHSVSLPSNQVSKLTTPEKNGHEVVRLPQETFNQSPADIKKAAKELVFNKFSGLLKNLA